MNNANSGVDDRPRLVVILTVVFVCLGTVYLIMNSRKQKEESSASNSVNTRAAIVPSDNAGSNQIVRRSATYRLGPPLRSTAPESPQVEQPRSIVEERETTAPSTAPDTGGSVPPPAGSALLLGSGIEISGTVTLIGTPSPEILIDMSADAVCAGLQKGPPTTRHYVLNKDAGLGNVFVHIKAGLEGGRFPVSTNIPVIGPSNCFFEPYVSGVRVSQKFHLVNADNAMHNAHITSRPGSGNKELNIGLTRGAAPMELSFPEPEAFLRIKCDVHPWEFGYLGVVSHPFFAVTDTSGKFRLPSGLPPGRYTLEAIHLKAGAATKEIEVHTAEKKVVDFSLKLPTHP